MSSKMANTGPHAAGIFADMTVDGPEIGTLVIIVDRAKNLPNRKTMGKQNPYAAARLGKEARKTETDQRGGQTPRWDQELRFTVHDSPDYYSLKISVFSEDKRTDLIGEAWVSLTNVVVPGGGKSDLWQQLNCRGKYAGDIRIELTYYDSREKAEKVEPVLSVADELKQTYAGVHGNSNSSVKRRPLPVNPNAPNTTPVVIPERALPGRARHGPRDFQTPSRPTSMPSEAPQTYNYPHSQSSLFGQTPVNAHPASASTGSLPAAPETAPSDQYYGEYDPNLGPQPYEPQSAPMPMQPDFLPQLAPSRPQRASLPPQARYSQRPPPQQQQQQPPPPHQQQYQHQPPPQHHAGLPHSYSAPAVPTHPEAQAYEDGYQSRTDYPEPIPDEDHHYRQERQRRDDGPRGWEHQYGSPYSSSQPYAEEELEGPPPPPIHSNSSPAVPHYGSSQNRPYPPPTSNYTQTPPSQRQSYVPNASPLQNIERGYGQYQTPPSHGQPTRGRSVDDYGDSPYQNSFGSAPNLTPPNQTSPSPSHGSAPQQYGRPFPQSRHSVADPYSTPSRPHPLSQQIPRARSPIPYAEETSESGLYQRDYRGKDAVPLIKPRAVSPQPAPEQVPSYARPKNTYSIQHPVRAFESSDESPLSTSLPASARAPTRQIPTRKSVSPRPSLSESSRTPFSPDSYDVHNPQAPDNTNSATRGPIVGWHGQEIDPSDHLPVDSWAPEPEVKAPSKTYGLGRDRDFGPRSAQGITTTAGRVSRDTLVNVRMKQAPPPPPEPEPEPQPQPQKIRARLVKRQGPGSGPAAEPLRGDHAHLNSVPDPYEQQPHQQQYSRGYRERSPGMTDGRGGGGHYDHAYGPPALPPKVPFSQQQQQQQDYGPDALSREIANIDIGTARRPAPTSFQPVHSHRDRHSYY